MGDKKDYGQAVELIKTAILQSQYDVARSVNEKQLILYYGIGKYVSMNSRNGFWGKGALETISQQLEKELPGLRGFSARSLRYMRGFYEEWRELNDSIKASQEGRSLNLAPAGAKTNRFSTRCIFFYWVFPSSNNPFKDKGARRTVVLYYEMCFGEVQPK